MQTENQSSFIEHFSLVYQVELAALQEQLDSLQQTGSVEKEEEQARMVLIDEQYQKVTLNFKSHNIRDVHNLPKKMLKILLEYVSFRYTDYEKGGKKCFRFPTTYHFCVKVI